MQTKYTLIATLALGLISATVRAEQTKTVWTTALDKAAEASYLIQRGDLQAGVTLTHEALAQKLPIRERAAVLANLCMAEIALRRPRDAIVHCTRAVEIVDNLWQGYNNRANAYLLLGDYDAAISDYKRALELRPEHRIVNSNLNLALDRKSRGVPPDINERNG